MKKQNVGDGTNNSENTNNNDCSQNYLLFRYTVSDDDVNTHKSILIAMITG
jgi:hypothetical protein